MRRDVTILILAITSAFFVVVLTPGLATADAGEAHEHQLGRDLGEMLPLVGVGLVVGLVYWLRHRHATEE
jgi:hypothetical protein